MREIKFRAWDKEDEVMIDWFWLSSEGDLYETPVTVYDTPHLELERKDDLIAMQYTGLKDKNSVEIYEGDIIEIIDENINADFSWREEVVFHNGCFMSGDDDLLINLSYRSVVIGNIHENPELIGGNQ